MGYFFFFKNEIKVSCHEETFEDVILTSLLFSPRNSVKQFQILPAASCL